MNKDDERLALDLVYRSRDQWTIAPGESPDFICLRHGQPLLGVEVTELWQDGTDARLSRIGGYFDSLLDGGDVAHKDDRDIAKVETIQLLPRDSLEPIAEVPALIRTYPSPAERANLLGTALAGKEKRVSGYLSRCTHVDLVIDDRSMLFWFNDFELLIRPISSHPVRECVTRSGFREVFLLTYAERGGRVHLPLKASLLMEDLRVLEELLSEEAPELTDQLYSGSRSSDVAVSVLFAAMGHLGHVLPAACVEDGRLGISIGCMTLHWTSQGKVARDYTCIPEQVVFAPDRLSSLSDVDRISRRIAEQRHGYNATISFAFPVVVP